MLLQIMILIRKYLFSPRLVPTGHCSLWQNKAHLCNTPLNHKVPSIIGLAPGNIIDTGQYRNAARQNTFKLQF